MLKTSLVPIKNHIVSKKERSKERNESLKRFQEWQQIKVKWRQDIARSRGLFLFDLFCGNCPVRDIKNRILQSSNSPILEFKVLQNAFKIKERGLKYFLK